MTAFYNEPDPFAAAWLRNLIDVGEIAPGVVDERDIRDLQPIELAGFTQCHFFAGIGVWSHALRRAGWPDDRPIWTGSCPCQPFSAAGRRAGIADERHLWPHWHWLISQCRPPIVVGEQVASKDGLGWLDLVSADMEASGYAIGASDLCAAGAGVDWQGSQADEWLQRAIHACSDPVIRGMLGDFAGFARERIAGDGGWHIRQRLYFVGVADALFNGERGRGIQGLRESDSAGVGQPLERLEGLCPTSRLADDDRNRRDEARGDCAATGHDGAFGNGPAFGVVNADSARSQAWLSEPSKREKGHAEVDDNRSDRCARSGARRSFDDGMGTAIRPPHSDPTGQFELHYCRDDKWKPSEPGSFPLTDATANRVGLLRGFGNALDAKTATGFVQAVMECVG